MLTPLPYTLPHTPRPTQTCCRCLHSRRSRTPHSHPMNSRTSSVERSRSTNPLPSPAVNTCLQYITGTVQKPLYSDSYYLILKKIVWSSFLRGSKVPHLLFPLFYTQPQNSIMIMPLIMAFLHASSDQKSVVQFRDTLSLVFHVT